MGIIIITLAVALVHGVLLELDVAQLLLELPALVHLAVGAAALAGVDLEERPDAPTHVAAAVHFCRALGAVLQRGRPRCGRWRCAPRAACAAGWSAGAGAAAPR